MLGLGATYIRDLTVILKDGGKIRRSKLHHNSRKLRIVCLCLGICLILYFVEDKDIFFDNEDAILCRGVASRQQHDCLFNSLLKRRTERT